MAKLVRRLGKLLRKGGKLVRSTRDLDPAAPCECCDTLPPDFGSWLCDPLTGGCEFRLNDLTGFETKQDCEERCLSGNCLQNCYYEIVLPPGELDCPGCGSATNGCVAEKRVVNGVTYCRLYYYDWPAVVDPGDPNADPPIPGSIKCDDRDECCLGSISLAEYLDITRQATIDQGYRKGSALGIRCPDGTCYHPDYGCPDNPFP